MISAAVWTGAQQALEAMPGIGFSIL